MRVPGTKIYRAFEELDRFSDEQCERFLAAALRPMIRRVLRWVVCLGAGLLVFACLLMGIAFLAAGFGGSEKFVDRVMPLLVLILVPSSVFSVILTRDVLLRRRMRYLIVNRGSCTACEYVLLGLPVSEANTVACPECGHISEVDPALGELAVAEDGSRTFRSSGQPPAPVFWNAKRVARVMRLAKWAGLTGVALALVLGGAVMWRYLIVEQDAAKAKAMLDPARVLGRHVMALAPKGVLPEDPNGWAVLVKLGGEFDDHCTDAVKKIAGSNIGFALAAYADFSLLGKSYVYNPGDSSDDATQRRYFELCKAIAEDAMRRGEAAGRGG